MYSMRERFVLCERNANQANWKCQDISVEIHLQSLNKVRLKTLSIKNKDNKNEIESNIG